jgi:carboxypeptidase T
MMLRSLLIILVLASWPIVTLAQGSHIVRFELSDRMKSFLRANELDVTGVNYKTGVIEALLTDEELATIIEQKAVIKYSYPQSLSAAPDEQYKNPQKIAEFVQEVHARYPEITKVVVIGKSLEGRDILAIKISDNAQEDEVEPAILVNAMHHAREVMTPEITTDMIEYLTTRYGTDPQVTKWVDNHEIWIVPMFNVDGNNKMWNENSMWRKNTRGGFGVDINRNYPAGWNSCRGSSSNQGAQDYRGTHPASEPETQAMMSLVEKIKPVFNISYHSYSEIVIYPFGCRPHKTPIDEAVEDIGAEIGRKLDYKPGTAWELLYNADGGDIDWMYSEHQVIPYVIEINSTAVGFHPAYNKWRDKTVLRNRPGWMYLFERMNGPSLQGVVDPAEYQEIKIYRASSGKELQSYRINPNGSYYIMLKPGRYDFAFEGKLSKKFMGLDVKNKIEINL